MPPLTDSPAVRFLALAGDALDEVHKVSKALKLALRAARECFAADEVCFASEVPGQPDVQVDQALPAGTEWDVAELASYLGERRPKMPPRLLAAPVSRRGRAWGVLALRRRSRDFASNDVRDVMRVAARLSRAVERIEAARLVKVRERIDRKVLEELRPNDLFYQILHGLRSLTGYDHSAAILLHEEHSATLRLVAEQIAWHKGKSGRIGIVRALDSEALHRLDEGHVTGFDFVDGQWREWSGRSADGLAAALDYNARGDERRELSVLCAPLATPHGSVGLIKVATCQPGMLGNYEGELVRRFLPQAATALQHVQRTRTLESGMLEAERKHALANLARGVSHDVNNALGSMLPLVQQLLEDGRQGRLTSTTLVGDLEQVEQSLRVCRRIFGGMLGFARAQGPSPGGGNLRRAVEGTLAVLEDSLGRRGIRVEVALPDCLPSVRGAQSDLEQLLLNLAINARDAMERGGALRIAVTGHEDEVSVAVTDTGCGIPPEHLARVREPFFTTKRDGGGLGLAICSSILSSMGGRMSIESQPAQGTCVLLSLPTASREPDVEGEVLT